MLNIARLFGKSPFAPLQTHMNKVASCIDKLTSLMRALPSKNLGTIEKVAKELSDLEHEADLTKNDIRNHLPNSIFLPIDRSQFLEILAVQDSIADQAEEVGLLLTLHPLEHYEVLCKELHEHYERALEVFQSSLRIMREVEELLESSFGGLEAQRVKSMVEETALKEHRASLAEHAAMKQLFHCGGTMTPASFYLWVHVLKGIGSIAGASERLANRIRMILELK
ncbi:MAG: TIGR00153 family protein [Simkania sp.]|nr:TIGR00153 family protein [Simkania sp.]